MLSEATVTFNLKDQLGDQFDARRTKIWVSTNVPDETIIDTDSGTIRLGSGNVLIDEMGNVSVTVWVPGSDSNPASWQTYIHVDYPDKNAATGRSTRDFGPFTITEDAALAGLVQQQEIPPTYLSEVAGALQGFVDDAQAAAVAAAAVGATNDGIIAGRVNDPASATNAALASKVPSNSTVLGAALAATFATTYYVSPTGNDTASGRTPALAWATIGRVSAFSGFKPGDRVLFERGGQWDEILVIPNSASWVTFGAYGDGPKPILNGADHVDSGWSAVSGGVYKQSLGQLVTALAGVAYGGIVIVGGTPLPWVEWNTNESTTVALMSGAGYATTGCMSHSKTGVTYVRMPASANPNGSGIVEVAKRQDLIIHGTQATHVTFEDLHLRGAGRHGYVGFGVTGTRIVRPTVELCGGCWSSTFYVGNGIEFNSASQDCQVEEADVHDIFDSGITAQVFTQGDNLAGVIISDARIARCAYAGIEFSLIVGINDASMTNLRVIRPVISSCGKGWSGKGPRPGRGITASTPASDSTNSYISGLVIEDPIITDCAGYGVGVEARAGVVTIRRGSITTCTLGGVRCYGAISGDTASLDMYKTEIMDCDGQGIWYDTFYGASPKFRRLVVVGNGAAAGANFQLDGFAGSPTIDKCAFVGYAAKSASYLYNPPSTNIKRNSYSRPGSGGIIVTRNSVNHYAERPYRTEFENDATFGNPIAPDPNAFSAYGFPYTVDPGIIRSTDHIPVPAANNALYLRVQEAGFVSKIAVKIGSQGNSISVAVYANVGVGRAATPGARLATSGALTCPVAGYAEIALGSTVEVRVGDWLCITSDTTVGTFASLLAAGADNDLGKGRQYRQASAHPAPSTPGTLIATVGYTVSLVGVA